MLPMDHIYVQNIQGATAVDLVCLVVAIAQGTDSNVYLSNWYWLPDVLCCTFCLCVTLWTWIYIGGFWGTHVVMRVDDCLWKETTVQFAWRYKCYVLSTKMIYFSFLKFIMLCSILEFLCFLVSAPSPYKIVVACVRYFSDGCYLFIF